jgi:hypothetical protein
VDQLQSCHPEPSEFTYTLKMFVAGAPEREREARRGGREREREGRERERG